MDLALEYADTAHEGMPYHWMAKIEYGRQLALTGDKTGALEKAKEAFWLQPKTIIQIQSDAAYRGLRKDFQDFLARLRETVREEIEAIVRAESKIDEFEKRAGVGSIEPEAIGFDALLSLFSPAAAPSFETSSATEPSSPPTDARDAERSESRSTLRLIAEGKSSASSSLEMLQRCAKQLSKDAVAFEFHGNKGYTSVVKELLQATIGDVSEKIRTLSGQRRQAGVEAQRANEKSQRLIEIGILVGGGMLVLLLLLALAGYLWMPDLFLALAGLVALGGLGTWVGYGEFNKLEQLSSAAGRKINTVEGELTEEKSVLTELKNQLRTFEQGELRLAKDISSLCDLTNRFESVALRRVTLSPVPPMDRRGNQLLVRIDPAKASDLQVKLDDQLLPLDLRYLVEDSSAKSRYWVGRRGKLGEIEVLSRSAAYFQ